MPCLLLVGSKKPSVGEWPAARFGKERRRDDPDELQEKVRAKWPDLLT